MDWSQVLVPTVASLATYVAALSYARRGASIFAITFVMVVAVLLASAWFAVLLVRIAGAFGPGIVGAGLGVMLVAGVFLYRDRA